MILSIRYNSHLAFRSRHYRYQRWVAAVRKLVEPVNGQPGASEDAVRTATKTQAVKKRLAGGGALRFIYSGLPNLIADFAATAAD
jgi:hypothetical protein